MKTTTLLAVVILATRVFAHAADQEIQQLTLPRTQTQSEAKKLRNPLIDYAKYRQIAAQVELVRAERRLTEEQFAKMATEPGTIVLDARSADKYAMRHISGAINLPFTDFTAESLAKVIPGADTRVLIYCNNNFLGAPRSLASKAAPASLNISTYIALATYGYKNVYELGPLLKVDSTALPFTGTEVPSRAEARADGSDSVAK